MKILIMGRKQNLYSSAIKISKHHNIVGIVTCKSNAEYSINESHFENLSVELGCPFLYTNIINNKVFDLIENTKPEIVISCNWISIIREEFIDNIPKGILNLHFGDLPNYRGNSVTNWAIVGFEKEITLTVHQMIAGELDSGDIWAQKKMTLDDDTTINDINDFSEKHAPKLFMDAINKISKGIKPKKQGDLGKIAFRCYPRLPVDSKIDWSKSALEINALVRASILPYPMAFSYIKEKEIIRKVYITSSYVVNEKTNDIGTPGHITKNDKDSGDTWVYTGEGIIGLRKIKFDGESEIHPGRYWKSIRIRFGIDIEQELINIYEKLQK
mgnify:CR=1 FL=1